MHGTITGHPSRRWRSPGPRLRGVMGRDGFRAGTGHAGRACGTSSMPADAGGCSLALARAAGIGRGAAARSFSRELSVPVGGGAARSLRENCGDRSLRPPLARLARVGREVSKVALEAPGSRVSARSAAGAGRRRGTSATSVARRPKAPEVRTPMGYGATQSRQGSRRPLNKRSPRTTSTTVVATSAYNPQ